MVAAGWRRPRQQTDRQKACGYLFCIARGSGLWFSMRLNEAETVSRRCEKQNMRTWLSW